MSTETFSGNWDWIIDLICVNAIDGNVRLENGISTKKILYMVVILLNCVSNPQVYDFTKVGLRFLGYEMEHEFGQS